MYNFSSFEEQAITRDVSFMMKDGRGSTRRLKAVSSQTSLSIFPRGRAAVPCFLCARFVQRLSGLLSHWVKLSLTGLVAGVCTAACHTQPFSCLGLCTTGVCGGYKDGARVHRKPASNVRPSPPQAQNMDQP